MSKPPNTWKPGQSGNPAGRPKNSGKVAELRALLQPHAQELVQKAVDMALDGDSTALRMCLERLVPPFKAESATVKVPALDTAENITEQGQIVLKAIASGDIPVDDALSVLNAINQQAKLEEFGELKERLERIEQAVLAK